MSHAVARPDGLVLLLYGLEVVGRCDVTLYKESCFDEAL